MIAAPDFLAAFPEFSNGSTFPIDGVTIWIAQGYVQLNAARFGAALDLAVMLFAAHNLVLGAEGAAAAAVIGGIPGQASGPLASKAVGPVSASFDTASVAAPGAGIYGQTQYGKDFGK